MYPEIAQIPEIGKIRLTGLLTVRSTGMNMCAGSLSTPDPWATPPPHQPEQPLPKTNDACLYAFVAVDSESTSTVAGILECFPENEVRESATVVLKSTFKDTLGSLPPEEATSQPRLFLLLPYDKGLQAREGIIASAFTNK
jgi:hypothetical protein